MAKPKLSSMMLTSLEDKLHDDNANCTSCAARRRMERAALGDRIRSVATTLGDGVMVALHGLADASRCIEPFVQNAASPVVLLARPKRQCTTCGSGNGNYNSNNNSNTNKNNDGGADDNANANNNQNTINIVMPPFASMYGGAPTQSGSAPNGMAPVMNFGQPTSPFAGNQFANPNGQPFQPQQQPAQAPYVIEREKVVPVFVPQIKEVIRDRFLKAQAEGKTKYFKQVIRDVESVNRPTQTVNYDTQSVNRPTTGYRYDQESINRPTVETKFDTDTINRPTRSVVYDDDAVNRPTNPITRFFTKKDA
jgi:hypothetical protein